MVHFCQVSRCRTSFKFKFCSKSAHFFGALFQSDLAPCFKSSQRPCSSTYVRIDIYIYIHRYIHTNSNVFIYICRSTHVYIHLHFCVRCPTHVYSHTYTRLVTNTHQGEGVKNRVFNKLMCHYQLLLEIILTLFPSYTLSVCICFFLVCCFVTSA